MNEWMNECMKEWVTEWVSEWVSEWVREWTDGLIWLLQLLLSVLIAVKLPSASRMLLLVLFLQLSAPSILAIFILKSLQWLKRHWNALNTKLFPSHTCIRSSSLLFHVYNLITVQPSRSTRSSTLATLLQPPVDSSLIITIRSFLACCTSRVEQSSSSATLRLLRSLSFWYIIITRLFFITTLWFWTGC